MLYSKYIYEAKKLCVIEDDSSGLFYLDPDWKETLCLNKLGDVDKVEAMYDVTWADVEDVLKLEADRRNKMFSKQPYIEDWIYELITAKVEPAMMQEETEYIANVLEYLKFRADHPDAAKFAEEASGSDKVKEIMTQGMSFTKKSDPTEDK